MDPLSQAVLGAAVPQSVQRKSRLALAGLFGVVAGMAPDLDVLIRSETDTLLYLDYHRQFSHSLAFAPIGGLICAVLLHFAIGRRADVAFRWTFLCCLLGYASHGPLDAMTSYGTQLLWPFSDDRVAWNLISVIDPLFTVPILVLVILSAGRKTPRYAAMALMWGGIYLGFGWVQQQRVLALGTELARSRGHDPTDMFAKPSFGNLIVWKLVYRDQGTFYVDAIRPWPNAQLFEGDKIAALDLARDFPWLDPASQQATDVARFRHFSAGYLAQHPEDPLRMIDLRYSLMPNEIEPLWSLLLSPEAGREDHAIYRTHRGDAKARAAELWQMITSDEGQKD